MDIQDEQAHSAAVVAALVFVNRHGASRLLDTLDSGNSTWVVQPVHRRPTTVKIKRFFLSSVIGLRRGVRLGLTRSPQSSRPWSTEYHPRLHFALRMPSEPQTKFCRVQAHLPSPSRRRCGHQSTLTNRGRRLAANQIPSFSRSHSSLAWVSKLPPPRGSTCRPRATLPGAAGSLGWRRPGKPRRDACRTSLHGS